jgi:hypothetical protein
MQTILLKLSDAWPLIQNADLLLWRGKGAISEYGRGVHMHASKLAWWDDEWMVLDTTWRHGASCRRLVTDVQHNSGRIDWFQVNKDNLPGYDRDGAVRYMRRLMGTRYGFGNIRLAIARHLPLVARYMTPEIDDDETPTTTPFCSDACSRADRIGGGYDPVPFASDRNTEPTDLARSDFNRYRGTLVADELFEKLSLPQKPRSIFSFLSLAS